MKVLVSGGGTGGHIYPAVALIKHIQSTYPEARFLYVGTEKGLESRIVPQAGLDFKTIKIQGFKRSLSIENFKTAYHFLKSIADSKKIIKEFQPDVVIGTGGYVCAAVVYAGHKLGVPTIIHEQNSVPGITNKFLAKYVDKIAICFSDAAQYFPSAKVTLTGNPRGQEVANIASSTILEKYALQAAYPTVLVVGGSQGALSISTAMMSALKELNQRQYQLLYVTGERYYDRVIEVFAKEVSSSAKISIQPYLKDMELVLKNVDLVVSRAGATTIAEITALGKPAILIPSPNVTNDHQTKNARSLVAAGAAKLLPDGELTGESLVSAIDEIMLNEAERLTMSQASAAEGIPDATERLLKLVETVIV